MNGREGQAQHGRSAQPLYPSQPTSTAAQPARQQRLPQEFQTNYLPPQIGGQGRGGASSDNFANVFQQQGSAARPAPRQPVYRPEAVGGGYGTHIAPPPSKQIRPAAMDEGLTPLNQLNSYCTRWTVMARCTSKSALRTYSNARGEGKVFSFDLLDGEDGQIRCTAFNEAAMMFHAIVEIGKIYRISKAEVSDIRNPKFKVYDTNYEIRLNMSSTVEHVPDEASAYPIRFFHYQFKPIKSIEEMESGAQIDVLGIVVHAQSIRRITKKNGDEVNVRNITIKDDTNCSIEVTLWDDLALNEGQEIEDAMKKGGMHIAAFARVRVGDYNQRSLSTQSASRVQLNPNSDEAHQLRTWGQQVGDEPVKALSQEGALRTTERNTLNDISIGTVDQHKATFFTVNCTICFIKQDRLFYPACPLQRNGRTCAKKLLEQPEGGWACQLCNESMENPNWRYVFEVRLQDHTDSHYATAFATAEEILQLPASDLKEMDDASQGRILDQAKFTPRVFLLKAMASHYQEELRLRLSIVRQQPLDFAGETKMSLEEIDKYKDRPDLVPAEHHHQQQGFDPSHEPQQSYVDYAVPQTPVHHKFGDYGFPS